MTSLRRAQAYLSPLPLAVRATVSRVPPAACSARRANAAVAAAKAAKAAASSRPPPRPVFYYSDTHEYPLPPGHRFPMGKYRTVRETLERDPALAGAEFRRAPLASAADVTRVHCAAYHARAVHGGLSAAEERAVGFPWSEAGALRALASTGGTVAATRALLAAPRMRVAGHTGGGTHHAHRASGGGFCVFNDIAVAAGVALAEFALDRVLVVDCDVHQGDGTAAMFGDDPRVTTFSMHGAGQAFPPRRARSDYDVALPDGTGDAEYLRALGMYVPGLLRRHRPQLVFYQAGVDALEEDALGRLALTRAGLSARNRMVYEACLERDVPVVVTLGGGYARPIAPSVDAHTDVYSDAMRALSDLREA